MSLNMSEIKNKERKTRQEVISALDSFDKELPVNPHLFSLEDESGEFEKILDQQTKSQNFKPGQIIKGEIIKVTEDHVFVDINYKSEGKIAISEFSNFNLAEKEEIKEGEKIDVYIEQIEDKNGVVVLSKDKANIKKIWQNITKAHENDEVIQGKVIAAVKGGLTIDVGIKAFLPGSHFDVRPVRNLAGFIGETMDFKIIKLNHKRGNVVLSRRAILDKDKEMISTPAEIKKGDIVEGIVKNITSYGAFIDLGARDGLLYITDMSWSRIEHPSEILKLGEKLKLKVLKFDAEKNRISLGLRQMTEDKWETDISKYEVGQTVKVRVSSVVDYGLFVKLEEDGFEGLIHVHELSWSRKQNVNPVEKFKQGDELEVKILDIKKASRKLSLSLKQTQDNPWVKVKELYSEGQEGEFEVSSISDFGVFVKITEELDGLIRVGDLSWSESVKPSEKYKVGDKIKAKVLDIDINSHRVSLGVKQLEENPWSLVEEKYPVGSRHEVEVVKIVDFGAFVRLEDNIEGLIHISELSKKRINQVSEVVNAGDKVTAEILNIDKLAKKIGLSIRLLETDGSGSHPDSIKQEGSLKEKPKPKIMENFFAKALKKSIKNTEDQNKEEDNQEEDKESEE